jgi:predicted GNAT family acetyltransferase
MTIDVAVTDAAERNRFEAHGPDGELAGFLDYIRTDDMVVYPHTLVEPAYEGNGVGSALAQVALDDALARGLRVLPSCPFVAAWMARHPAYRELEYRD